MYTQPLSNHPIQPKDFFKSFIIAIVGLIVFFLFMILTGCSSVKKHKSASEYKIDTSGSVYVQQVEVKKKDSTVETSKTEQIGSLKTVELNDSASVEFGDSAVDKPTIIENNGTKITVFQPVKKFTTKNSSKKSDKDTSIKKETAKTALSNNDSLAKAAGQTANKKASGSQSEIDKNKNSFNLGWLWLLAIIPLIIYRNKILGCLTSFLKF